MASLKEKFESYLKVSGFSQEGVAKAMGISGSILSSWRKGRYNGDNERVEGLVSAYLARVEHLAERSKGVKRDFDFVETSVYERVVNGAELAEVRQGIRVVMGDSGVGKTTALEHLKGLNESMILFRAYPGIRKNRVLAKLCKEAGLGCRGSFDDLFEELTERLEGTNRLIAIDEVEHLPIEAVDAVRRLNDFTGCPVILVGLPVFYQTLKKYQQDYAYVFNRVSIPVAVGRNSVEDAGAMVATMLDCDVSAEVWHEACGGIGRDLKEIVLESLRVAKLNGIKPEETERFVKVVQKVKKSLNRV